MINFEHSYCDVTVVQLTTLGMIFHYYFVSIVHKVDCLTMLLFFVFSCVLLDILYFSIHKKKSFKDVSNEFGNWLFG